MAADHQAPTPEDQAKEAAAKLKLFKVTSTRKEPVPRPNAGWSLAEGANHFEGEIPEAVQKLYAELVEQRVIVVEVLDATGTATAWEPKKPTTQT